METFTIYLILVITGLCMGSFAGATVWRLRARQLSSDKAKGLHVNHDEHMQLKKLANSKLAKDRSQCLNCSYALKWYDLIPVFSWLSLGGKCRECRKPIGLMELLIELAVATFFGLSYAFWPLPLESGFDIIRFIVWLVAGVGLAILFVYDIKWFLLPDQVNFIVIMAGLVSVFLATTSSLDIGETLINVVVSVLVLSGLYLALYLMSGGKWVGFGDVKLGLGLGLLLADWRLALLALFLANFIGCLIVLPGILSGKLKRNSHIPFGPLLISGFVIAGLAGNYIIGQFFLPLI
jgi:prepilin signal peptidase PulO-like enzyme (type II secretory pathway)